MHIISVLHETAGYFFLLLISLSSATEVHRVIDLEYSTKRNRITSLVKVSRDNPSYFSAYSGKIICLAGSHKWSSLKDSGITDLSKPFSFDGYMDFLRLWTLELTKYCENTTLDNSKQ